MDNRTTENLLISGKAPFIIDVPFKLIETGEKCTKKPLILCLHGFNDNLISFENTCKPFLHKLNAYHLFLEAPYPLYNRSKEKKVEEWGRSWYLYDGRADQFIRSLEKTSQFIQDLIDQVNEQINIDRICMIGYSMGGYLAGYFAMTRPKYVDDLVVVGARIKTEVLNENWNLINHLQILALHGMRDNIVDYKPQRSEIRRLEKKGINANFKLIDQKHIFNKVFINEIIDWLFEKGYAHNNNFSNH